MLLVTGMTGHTGRYFADQLIKNKYKDKIRCVVRETSNVDFLKNSNLEIEFVYGDLNDVSFINKIMRDVNIVMHIYNIHHSINIVNGAIDNKVDRVILVHTTGIYSKFKSASEGYKRIEKEILEVCKDKIKLTILRPTMIYGDMCDHNMSKFIKMIDKMKVYPLINGGKGLIQPVNARNLGKAYYDVLMNAEVTANKQYDLSGDKPITMEYALKTISYKLNKKTIFIPISLKLGVFVAQILKIFTFGRLDIVEKVMRMGEDRAYSHQGASKDFNYKPMTFEKGIQIEVDQFNDIKTKR